MEWSPSGTQTAVLALVGTALAASLVALDSPGRLLAGTGALLLLGLAGRDLLARPRLRAGSDGVTVATLTGRRQLPWAGLRVQVRESRRLGLRGRTLELDSAAGSDDDGELVVLGRSDLGADPVEVAAALRELDLTRD